MKNSASSARRQGNDDAFSQDVNRLVVIWSCPLFEVGAVMAMGRMSHEWTSSASMPSNSHSSAFVPFSWLKWWQRANTCRLIRSRYSFRRWWLFSVTIIQLVYLIPLYGVDSSANVIIASGSCFRTRPVGPTVDPYTVRGCMYDVDPYTRNTRLLLLV